MATQNQMFRLTSIAFDLIRSARSVSSANAQLRMLDTMPDEKGRSGQAIIVSVCCVLMLIYDELKGLSKNADSITRQLYDSMIEAYTQFNNFLHREFISLRFNLNDVMKNHVRKRIIYIYCYHDGDWISRFICTDFVPQRIQSIQNRGYKFDTPDWLDFVQQIKERAPAKLASYKLRYFVIAYFFVALDCSAPVVEAVDVTLFCLSKN
jgi:hypothetical protein